MSNADQANSEIAAYARQLAAEFIDPNSRIHAHRKGSPTHQYYASNDPAYPYPRTVYDINCGHCENFAEYMRQQFPEGDVVDLAELYINDPRFLPKGFNQWTPDQQQDWIDGADLPAHYVFLCGGRYYDAQNPDGVDDWAQLDVMRYYGVVTRSEYLRGKGLAESVVRVLLEDESA